MAVDILLDKDGDIDLSNNIMTLTPDKQTVARQQVLITLSMFRGEWVFNINQGVPYLANNNNPIHLLGTSPKELLDYYIKDSILKTEYIEEILQYSSELDKTTRRVEVDFSSRADSGEVVSIQDTVTI